MLYLTDDLSLFSNLDDMTVLQIYPVTAAQVKKLLKKHEYKFRTCVSSKFAAKRLSQLTRQEVFDGCPPGIYINNRGKATIIYFHTYIRFRDDRVISKWLVRNTLLQFSVIELVPIIYLPNNYNIPVNFTNE